MKIDRWSLLKLTRDEEPATLADHAVHALTGEGPVDPVLGVLDAAAADLSALALVVTRAEDGPAEDMPIGGMLAGLARHVQFAATMIRQCDAALEAQEGGAA